MAWRVARSLDTLLAQIDAAYPSRSKRSDGSIGDAAHASRSSDHNPWYGPGIVTARDFTHDPANGFDAHALAERLRQERDPRIKYVISNGRIFSATVAPWTWRKYTGPNPHNKHIHVSVVASSRCDDTNTWAGVTASTSTTGSRIPNIPEVDDDMPLNDADKVWLTKTIREQVWNSALPNKVSAANNLLAIRDRTDRYVDASVSGLTAALAGLRSGSVDVAALAKGIADELGSGTAKKVADEIYRRMGA